MRVAIGVVLFALCGSASADVLLGRVVGVSDGDTITLLDNSQHQHKIRLAGIDAPERAQPFGARSKQHLSELVFSKPVAAEWHKIDRYGRKVAKVMVGEPSCAEASCPKTLDAGLAQVTIGMAWWYRQYAREQSVEDREKYELGEAEARARSAGLWSNNGAIAPWEWRATKRSSAR